MTPLVLPDRVPCTWVLGGVHGEVAGVAAIASHGPFPPYCLVHACVNPLALLKGEHQGDAEDYIPLMWELIGLTEKYPPKLIISLHEDNEAFQYAGFYLYHYGRDPHIPQTVLDAVRAAKLPIAPTEDDTWENERIVDGTIATSHETLLDPNIDEYAANVLGAEVIVAETPSTVWPVKARLRAHAAVLSTIPRLWEMVNE